MSRFSSRQHTAAATQLNVMRSKRTTPSRTPWKLHRENCYCVVYINEVEHANHYLSSVSCITFTNVTFQVLTYNTPLCGIGQYTDETVVIRKEARRQQAELILQEVNDKSVKVCSMKLPAQKLILLVTTVCWCHFALTMPLLLGHVCSNIYEMFTSASRQHATLMSTWS